MGPSLIEIASRILFAAGGCGVFAAAVKLILERQRQDHQLALEKQQQDHQLALEKQQQDHQLALEKQQQDHQLALDKKHQRNGERPLRNTSLADFSADGSVSTMAGETSELPAAPSETAQGQSNSLPEQYPEDDGR
jgi:serine phosphatase RsbU (regulator of sigma subunit)